MSEQIVISRNEKRNMMMVIINGKTCHVPITDSKPAMPQTGIKNPKGGKKQKPPTVKTKEETTVEPTVDTNSAIEDESPAVTV